MLYIEHYTANDVAVIWMLYGRGLKTHVSLCQNAAAIKGLRNTGVHSDMKTQVTI